MRTSQISLFALCIITLLSCQKDEVAQPNYNFIKVDSINWKYLIDKEKHSAPSSIGGTAYFQYVGNKLSKRLGGYKNIITGGGYSGFYTTEIYDTVEFHNSNTITIITKDNLNGMDVYPRKREITLKNEIIVKKITFDENNPDTIYYYYDSQNRLTKTEQFFKISIITKNYLFDSNNNLQKISTVKKAKDDGFVYYVAEELFGGYDNKVNPLSGQTLWQDLLYRTLSKNNFTTYTYSEGTNFETISWTLIYDNNGNVDYSK